MYSVSGVFRISQGGDTSMWWGAGEGSGEGAVRAPYLEKNRFLRPQNDNFGGILTRFMISYYRCNNGVQNPFSVPYNLLRVFEDDNTTNYTLN